MRCALVESSSGLVTNLIIADPAVDSPPVGCFLVGLSDDSPVSIGWVFDGENFIDPNALPEPVLVN